MNVHQVVLSIVRRCHPGFFVVFVKTVFQGNRRVIGQNGEAIHVNNADESRGFRHTSSTNTRHMPRFVEVSPIQNDDISALSPETRKFGLKELGLGLGPSSWCGGWRVGLNMGSTFGVDLGEERLSNVDTKITSTVDKVLIPLRAIAFVIALFLFILVLLGLSAVCWLLWQFPLTLQLFFAVSCVALGWGSVQCHHLLTSDSSFNQSQPIQDTQWSNRNGRETEIAQRAPRSLRQIAPTHHQLHPQLQLAQRRPQNHLPQRHPRGLQQPKRNTLITTNMQQLPDPSTSRPQYALAYHPQTHPRARPPGYRRRPTKQPQPELLSQATGFA